MTAWYPVKLSTVSPDASTVSVGNLRPVATPLESVIPDPVGLPSPSFRMTLVPAMAAVSADTVISSDLSLLKTPEPVTSTVVASTVPSTKSIVPEPLITASLC